MIVIGLDVHKQSVTAVAVDEAGRPLAEKLIEVGSEELLGWAAALDAERLWALEDCRQLTGWLECQLLAVGEQMVRVPPKLTLAHTTRRAKMLSPARRIWERWSVEPETNKRIVERFYDEVWTQGNVDFAHQVFMDDHVRHDLRPTQAEPGPAGQAAIARAFGEAFPDLRWRVDLILAEGDFVAARWTASGTHTGEWAGVTPTGRRAEFSGVNIFRFGPDGKVAEIWNHRDDLGLREQLGAPIYAGAPASQGS